MKTIARFAQIIGVFLAGTAILAGVIFPFTTGNGVRGFLTVHGWCSAAITALGAIFVYAAQDSRRTANDMDLSGNVSNDVADEIRKDANRGADLGLELFYSGLVCTVLVFYVRSKV